VKPPSIEKVTEKIARRVQAINGTGSVEAALPEPPSPCRERGWG
jgi:hypothetical protein